MSFGLDDFARRSDQLLRASATFQDSLASDEADQSVAVEQLLAAARPPREGVVFRLTEGSGTNAAPTVDPGDALAAVLLELQSGTMLVSAGAERGELGPNVVPSGLAQTRALIAESRTQLLSPPAALRLAAELNVASATPDSARQQFKTYGDLFLGEIVDEVQKTSTTALKNLGRIGVQDIGTVLGNMGVHLPEALPGGLLVRRGIESIKGAVDGLVAFVGGKAFDLLTDGLRKLWADWAKGGRFVFEHLLGVEAVKVKVTEILASAQAIPAIDAATNALAPLSGRFTGTAKWVDRVGTGLGFAVSGLAFLHWGQPWATILVGVGLLAVIAASLLIGGDFTGGRRLLGWVEGVGPLAERIRAT